MRTLLIAIAVAAAGGPALAQHAGHAMPMPPPAADPHAGHGAGTTPAPAIPPDPHAGHRMAPAAPAAPASHPVAADPPGAPPPPAAMSGPRHAADRLFDPAAMAGARERLRHEQGASTSYGVTIERLEARIHDGRDGYLWDAQGWYGGDIDKLRIRTEGEGGFRGRLEEAELQVLWSHAVDPWLDAQAGIRYDIRPGRDRGHLVAGLHGLLPYRLEVDGAAFVSNDGDVSARLEAEYDLPITQRLVLQPRAEVNLALQDARAFGVGRGINDVGLGLRLRYEVEREFAPYFGVDWKRRLGRTAGFARDEGEEAEDLFFVAGVRIAF